MINVVINKRMSIFIEDLYKLLLGDVLLKANLASRYSGKKKGLGEGQL